MNHYEALGVGKDASADDIKRARKRQAKRYHPDRAGGDNARMALVNKAYDTLSDPEKRKRYDETGQDSGPESRPPTLDERAYMKCRMVFDVAMATMAEEANLLSASLKLISAEEMNLHMQAGAVPGKLKKIERQRKKIRRRKDKDADVLREFLEDSEQKLKAIPEQVKNELAVLKRVKELIDQYEAIGPVEKDPIQGLAGFKIVFAT